MADDDVTDGELDAVVEQLARTAFGNAVTLGEKTGLGGSNRSNVWRWQLQGGAVPAVVVKQVNTENEPYEPEKAVFGPASRLFNEWAALQLLTDLKADFAPRFYSGDRAARVIMLEDLGTAPTLDKLLLGDDAQATETAVVNLARALGQLHALTAGHRADYERLRTALGPPLKGRPTADDAPLEETEMAGLLLNMVEPLKIKRDAAVDNELQQLTRAWQDNFAYAALIHADPCPDNVLVLADQVKLMDFEFSRIGSALIDGTYWRSFFPTCWCFNRLPLRVVERMEQVYRAELVKGFSTAQDDAIYYRAVVEACLSWAISFLNWDHFDPFTDDFEWGIATVRQRVLFRFEVGAQVCEQYGYYPAVGQVFNALATALRQQWPESVHTVPEYPAFR